MGTALIGSRAIVHEFLDDASGSAVEHGEGQRLAQQVSLAAVEMQQVKSISSKPTSWLLRPIDIAFAFRRSPALVNLT